MNRYKQLTEAVRFMIIALCATLVLASCDKKENEAPEPNAIAVKIATIQGVSTPVTGVAPVTTITETEQYTGTVTWSPVVSGTFAAGTEYTAAITLTAKRGYTFNGVAADFFTVEGATTVSNAANSAVVTAKFPASELFGKAGSLNWKITDDGTLIISGTGAIWDYYSSSIGYFFPPWHKFKSSISVLVIENGVTSIGGSAFWNCSVLMSVTIPNSVTSIGDGAFGSCSGLTSVTIPSSVTSIGDGAFGSRSGLMEINVDAANSAYSSENGVLFDKDKTRLIAYPTGKTGAYTIPNSVTSIGKNAFCECSGLTELIIPNSVEYIGDWAFSFCSALISVTIPNSAESIGDYAFSYCSGLTSVTIPNSVKTIGNMAFYNCSLASVAIPNSVTSIESIAFAACSSLTEVTIPNSVTYIGSEAFYGCSDLTTVNFNAANCSAMERVVRHNSQAGVYYTFSGCSKLTTVNIGSEVSIIPDNAFGGCSGLNEIIDHATTPQTIGANAFDGVNRTTCTLRVPAASVAAYQAATRWKDFVNIVAIE